MTWQLKTYLYDRSAGWIELTDAIKELLLRASLPGGLQTIEFGFVNKYTNIYPWVYDHLGDRIFVFDNVVNRPVAEGVILESSISEDGSHVVAAGPWQAYMFNQVYNDTSSWIGAGTTSEQIKDILTTECPDISADQSSIESTFTHNYPWQPTDNAHPGDLIPFLTALGLSGGAELYFWLESASLVGNEPQKPVPKLTQAGYVRPYYQMWRKDMAPGGLNLVPSIRGLANDVRVIYRDAAGAQRQTTSAPDSDSQDRYGLREGWDYDLGQARAAAANQYRNILLERWKDPQQSASFMVNTYVYGGGGDRWPLWRLIADFPVKLVVSDLLPDYSSLYFILDGRRTFVTLAAEYDYDRNVLYVVPDTEDNRADAMLARHRAFR